MGNFTALKDIEPMAGDVYAFRGFEASSSGELVGMTYLQPILPGANRARCPRSENHEAPAADCTCGFYAFDTEPNTWRPGQIDAVVKLSGRVIVCERGVRAEVMEIVALSGGGRFIADGMGIPWFEASSEMLKHFPVTQIERPEEEFEDAEEAPMPPVFHAPIPSMGFKDLFLGQMSKLSMGFKGVFLGQMSKLKRSKGALLGSLLVFLVIASSTGVLYFAAGVQDYLLLTPLVVCTISLQASTATASTSARVAILIGLMVALGNLLGVEFEKLPGHLGELLTIGLVYAASLHILNLFRRPKAGMLGASPTAFITGGMGTGHAIARRATELAPNPVKTNPSDTEGR